MRQQMPRLDNPEYYAGEENSEEEPATDFQLQRAMDVLTALLIYGDKKNPEVAEDGASSRP